jgi:hypothetical protein
VNILALNLVSNVMIRLQFGWPVSTHGGGKDLALRLSFQSFSEAHLASYSAGTGTSFAGDKWPGSEADRPLPSNTKFSDVVFH